MALSEKRKRWGLTAIRVVVTLLLLGFLARSIDFDVLSQLFLEIELMWVGIAAASILVVRFFIALRWKTLLASHDFQISLWSLNKIIFISMFAGQFLPGVIGTDIVRGYMVAKSQGRTGTVVMTLLIDRIVGIYGMGFVAVIGVLVAEMLGRSTGLLTVVLLFIFFLVISATVLILGVERIRRQRWFLGTRWEKLSARLVRLAFSATTLMRRHNALTGVLIVSVAIVLVRCYVFYCLYRAFGASVPFDVLMVFIPIMFVAVLLPVSLGGLGVRETTLVYLFRTMGVAAEVSVSVGLIFHFLQIALSSPGIVFWISERQPGRSHANKTADHPSAIVDES